MTNLEFMELRQVLDDRCSKVLSQKAELYARERDRLSNFHTIADMTGETALSVWAVLFAKHSLVLTTHEGSQVKLEESIIDARNYLDLLYALLRTSSDESS